jgi:hypothetical protein
MRALKTHAMDLCAKVISISQVCDAHRAGKSTT